MSLMQTVEFDTQGNFTFDSSKIQFTAGTAALKLVNNAGQIFSQSFASASGFTYDSSYTEFAAGVVRQKDARPAGATYYAAWASQLNANWGDGSLVVTSFNSAAVSGGFLDLTGSTNKYVTLVTASNIPFTQTGTVVCRFKPNYSGTPGVGQAILNLSDTFGSLVNFLDIEHFNDGNLYFQVGDSAGVVGISLAAPFNPTAGTTYMITAQFNANTGVATLLVNGSSVATTTIAPFTRTAVGYAAVGKFYNNTGNANFSVGNMAFYSTVVSPSTAILAPYIYNADIITLPSFAYPGPGNVIAFTAAAITDTNNPRYTLDGKYWNGSAWVASNNTYAQANIKADVIANIATLGAVDTLTVKVYTQDSNSVQMSTDDLSVTYTSQSYPTTDPTIVINSALFLDELDAFEADTTMPSGTDVGFTVLIASSGGGSFTEYYHNGSAWVAANGTYAQSNSESELNDNSDDLDALLVDGKQFKIKIYLHSDGTAACSITEYIVSYNFFVVPEIPAECIVYGWILRQDGEPAEGGYVKVILKRDFMHTGNVIAASIQTIEADDDGYWEISLVETESVGKTYDFWIGNTEEGVKVKKLKGVTVPAQDSAALEDISNF